WEEVNFSGQSRFFEATAFRSREGSTELLLIQPVDERFGREQAILQSVHDQRLDRRRLQKELEKKQILLECIMHDLGNPLATVLMNLQHLGRKLQDEPDLMPAVQRAIGQAERQRTLIRSIAEVFAADLIGAGVRGVDSSADPADLAKVAAAVIANLAPVAAEKSVTLCPMFQKSAPVRADGFHLARVLENLIVNAIRHSPERGRVVISFQEQGPMVQCTIEDEGKGIEPSVADRLFKPFSQGVQTPGQSGLGLYFCRMAIEQWGGEIEAANLPQGGASFRFRLPVAKERRDNP
ncbi:MAG: HAMP domain-containing histidine kinase, partial [Verrucomicrobiae bacterium]|nr:HAMP domain-containing histidine kinase [Verrucomicrobiae bacterium]